MTTPPVFVVFRFWNGSTITEPLIVRNPDGTPQDLTGYRAAFTAMREAARPADPLLLDLTTENGGIAIEPLTGTLTWAIDSAASAAIAVDLDGEMWPFKLLLIRDNTPPTDPLIVDRLVQGYVVAQP